jgi:hypothetical protein
VLINVRQNEQPRVASERREVGTITAKSRGPSRAEEWEREHPAASLAKEFVH